MWQTRCVSSGALARQWTLFRRDAARWVRPEQIAALDEVTCPVAARLLVRHMPLRAMAWLRFATACRSLGIRGVPSYVSRRLLRIYGLEMSPAIAVGGGLYIAHPVGCVLHAERIGENVTVVGQATFGFRGEGWPTIDDGAFIGIGARVLGRVHVGAGARVGANSVVLADVAPGSTVVGSPARPTSRRGPQAPDAEDP